MTEHPMEWMTCPVCPDDIRMPADPAAQVRWLQRRAQALSRVAARVEAGENYEDARSSELIDEDD